ncbi:hypothetical protein ETB97_007795, partial [Aspergillus alliaceus]
DLANGTVHVLAVVPLDLVLASGTVYVLVVVVPLVLVLALVVMLQVRDLPPGTAQTPEGDQTISPMASFGAAHLLHTAARAVGPLLGMARPLPVAVVAKLVVKVLAAVTRGSGRQAVSQEDDPMVPFPAREGYPTRHTVTLAHTFEETLKVRPEPRTQVWNTRLLP